MDSNLMRRAAEEIAARLATSLDDLAATSVTLTRAEALLCQGLLQGIAELLKREEETGPTADPNAGLRPE